LIGLVNILCSTQHKIGHFGDVLPCTSLGLVLKKLTLTQQKQTTQEHNGKNTQKANLTTPQPFYGHPHHPGEPVPEENF